MANPKGIGFRTKIIFLMFLVAAVLTVVLWPSGAHAQTTEPTRQERVAQQNAERLANEEAKAAREAVKRQAEIAKRQAEREEKLAEARFRAELAQVRNGSRPTNAVETWPRTIQADESKVTKIFEDGRERSRVETTASASKTREAGKLELDLAKERRKAVEAQYRDQCGGFLGAWRCSPSGYYSGGAYATGGSASGTNIVSYSR